MDLRREVALRGGLAATHELLRAGATAYDLRAAVTAGELVRIRQGWYALPGTSAVLESAVRVGGRATCVTAARDLGLWVIDSPTVHVRIFAHDARLRQPGNARQRLALEDDSVCRHWGPRGVGTRFRLNAPDALADMITCQSPERTVAAAESALRAGLLAAREWEQLVSRAPQRQQRLLGDVDPRTESIIESITRFRLRRLGFLPEPQVDIPGVGRVDLVIGRVVIELDGWEHHHSRESFENDRQRDARLTARGYRVLRFTYRAVMHHWAEVRDAIMAAVAATN
ncbi:DUF559 domain-containing protein [uncultured Schumannella sp.]|uniref:DUF559 domain-containing protein n=1 Tax=uncultured Schumannella sp. TaxID=1195956 RepID=UPI0025D274DE|nr:DUF559 domain-containing protein [uncultured Schumannella sp.]